MGLISSPFTQLHTSGPNSPSLICPRLGIQAQPAPGLRPKWLRQTEPQPWVGSSNSAFSSITHSPM